MATVMSYGVEEILDSCVAKYCEFAKITSALRSYTTPILLDDHSRSAAGAPGTGPVAECPMVPSYSYPDVTCGVPLL